MTASNRVMRILDDFLVPYRRIPHRQAFTAGEVARESGITPQAMAKVVVARDDSGGYVMAVLPASMRVDLAALETACGRGRLTLASEGELSTLFPDCDQGAMPPFGGPYGMATFVDAGLRDAHEIHFQPGSRRETAALPFAKYQRLAEPVVGRFALQPRPSREAAPVAT